jgi:4-hydroxy-tetrahydrodipicolinate synthase
VTELLERKRARHEELRAALRGVAVTTISPFTPDSRELARDEIAPHVRSLTDAGVPLLVPCGNTGEHQSLTRAEWEVVLTETVAAAGGTPVMPGIGGAIHDAIKQAEVADDLSAIGVMVLPPHHTYQSVQGVLRYYEAILEAVSLGVVLYVRNRAHAPAILDLADHPNLVGVKFAVRDVARFASLVASSRTAGLIWSCGIAEAWAPFFMLAGAAGFTSGIANLYPAVPLALHEAASRGDWRAAMTLRGACVPFEALRARKDDGNNITVVKEALDALGRYGGPVRPPLAALSSDDRADLAQAIEALAAAARDLPTQPRNG